MIELYNDPTPFTCPRCGYAKARGVACKGCLIETLHEEDCRLRRSVTHVAAVECSEHQRVVCPECDECTCKEPVALMRRARKLLWYGPIGETLHDLSPNMEPLAPLVELTPSEARLLESADDEGHAWVGPAQLPMARRLRDRGLLTIDDELGPHPLMGASMRRVTVCAGREASDVAHGG